MKRINPPQLLQIADREDYEFDVYSFEDLVVVGIHLAVLPGIAKGENLIINLAHVREFYLEPDGSMRIRFSNDPANQWQVLTIEQSDALCEKVQSIREAVASQLANQPR